MSIWGIGPLLAATGGRAFLLVWLLQHVLAFSMRVPGSFLTAIRILGLGWGMIHEGSL
jgi:hypothetical protein